MIISEKESKLLIDNQHGRSVIDGVKILEEIGPFRLGKNVFIEIEDAYFDLNKFVLAFRPHDGNHERIGLQIFIRGGFDLFQRHGFVFCIVQFRVLPAEAVKLVQRG